VADAGTAKLTVGRWAGQGSSGLRVAGCCRGAGVKADRHCTAYHVPGSFQVNLHPQKICLRTNRRLHVLLRVALILGPFAVTSCKDAADPLAIVLAAEAQSLLNADLQLPNPADLAAMAGVQEQLAGSLDRWSRSWALPHDEGREERSATYLEVASPLADSLGAEGVGESVRSLGGTLAAVEALDAEALAGPIGATLVEARARHTEALAALDAGRDGHALTLAFTASDLVREVGAEGVGRLLLARAERELDRRRAQSPGTTQGEDFRRGQRLIRGARIAMDAGDHVLAIQRAFYACQVLGLGPS